VTLWDDIVGYTCSECGKWATHWYFHKPICCSCHIGALDVYMEKEAIAVNTRFQKGLPIAIDIEHILFHESNTP
jgi:hypothetical protein